MKIGEKLYHPQRGEVIITGKKWMPLKNASVFMARDEDGETYQLDGSEKPVDALDQELEIERRKLEMKQEEDESEEEMCQKEEEEKMKHEQEMEAKHAELLEAIKTAPQPIVEAIKTIPQAPEAKESVTIKNPKDISSDIVKEFRASALDIIESLEKIELDDQGIIEAVKEIKLEIPKAEPQKFIDYTKQLKEIADKLNFEIDWTPIITAITQIPRFEIPAELITKDNRLKVEVDRVALGGPNGGVDTSSLATEETLQSVVTEQQQLEVIASSIQELVSRLDFLPAVRGIAADLRVTLLSGTVTTVTTVTTVGTVTGITNIGGIPAVQMVPATQGNLAIQSNINNVIIN